MQELVVAQRSLPKSEDQGSILATSSFYKEYLFTVEKMKIKKRMPGMAHLLTSLVFTLETPFYYIKHRF